MKNLLKKISKLKALVVGDIMLDHYIIGDSTRISPEAPVPVVNVFEDKYVLGAAANVAVNLSSFSANVEVCGIIGEDFAGNKIRELFNLNNIKFDTIFCKSSVNTIIKTRVLARGQQLCRLDREQSCDNYSINEESFFYKMCDKIDTSDVVILSDYAKGAISKDNVQKVIDYAHASNKFVALDPKPKRNLAFKNVDLITPNFNEACELSGVEARDISNIDIDFLWKICKNIYERFSPKMLVITMGAHGMLLSEKGKVLCKIPTYAREIFDVSGAGDTSVACLSAALGVGEELRSAAHFANIASGIVVGKIGTATALPDEILNFNVSC